MPLYKAPLPQDNKTYSHFHDDFEWPKQNKRKVIIAVGSGAFMLTSVITLISLIVGILALGTLGLIADSPEVIEDSRRIIVYDEEEDYSAYDNSSAYPPPGNQGRQGSCTAWATAYALKSAQEKMERGWDYSAKTSFSPAYIYNQINEGQDGGSRISEAMQMITQQGVCSLEDMPYDEKDYLTKPNDGQVYAASPYKAKEWFSLSGVDQIKSAIVKYGGVVVGISVYSDFDKLDEKNPIYDVQSGKKRGGHAICLVGFDDKKSAFKLINSWGDDWGLEGFGWVSYEIVEKDIEYYGAFSMEDIIV